jgi:hypothetical protein
MKKSFYVVLLGVGFFTGCVSVDGHAFTVCIEGKGGNNEV